jgi:hypothetical protein
MSTIDVHKTCLFLAMNARLALYFIILCCLASPNVLTCRRSAERRPLLVPGTAGGRRTTREDVAFCSTIESLKSLTRGFRPSRPRDTGKIELIAIRESGLFSRTSSTALEKPKATTSSEHFIRPKSLLPRLTRRTLGLKLAANYPCMRRQKTLGDESPAVPKAPPCIRAPRCVCSTVVVG